MGAGRGSGAEFAPRRGTVGTAESFGFDERSPFGASNGSRARQPGKKTAGRSHDAKDATARSTHTFAYRFQH